MGYSVFCAYAAVTMIRVSTYIFAAVNNQGDDKFRWRLPFWNIYVYEPPHHIAGMLNRLSGICIRGLRYPSTARTAPRFVYHRAISSPSPLAFRLWSRSYRRFSTSASNIEKPIQRRRSTFERSTYPTSYWAISTSLLYFYGWACWTGRLVWVPKEEREAVEQLSYINGIYIVPN